MGLFDRFKKKTKDAVDRNEITVEEGTNEAEKILQKREELLSSIEKSKTKDITIDNTQPLEVKEDEWDDFSSDELKNPFSKEKNKKTRKISQQNEKIDPIKPIQTKPIDRMKTTTGRELVPVVKDFEIDLSDAKVTKGGLIIRGGPVLDEILFELEEELLQSDMGHSAVMEVISTLKANLIGSRINIRVGLETIVEKIVYKSLQNLLEAGYWDFDRTIHSFVTEGTPISIMIVGVNGTGKTTTTAKIAHRLTEQGYSVVLAAADTFRAGAIDQLVAHADKIGVRCIKSQRGGDSAAVSRDAIESAKAKGDDLSLIHI